MTALKAMVILSDDDGKGGQIHSVDVIEFEGKAWLVPEWLDSPDAKVTMPARIVLLDSLKHSRGEASPQVVVDDPIPKSIFDGRAPPAIKARYVVIERPDLRLPLPGTTH